MELANEYEIEIDYDEVFLPVYKPLQNCKERLRFLYGGRDSGKSRDIAMRKILQCLESKNFRCLLIKKTKNSIKDSQWQLIKDICESWNIEHLFDFRTHPLEIRCKLNGNKFIARGMDDPAKIKSINNPTDAWVEEGNQLTLQDWIYIITTLRSDETDVTIEMSFNTETKGDFEEFWLYKEYFAHTKQKSFRHQLVMKVPGDEDVIIDYIAIHTTYHDNRYVPRERKAYHESLQNLNMYWYKVFTLGEWGNEENNSPWLFTFNRNKHISLVELFPDKAHLLYLSWDFNRNPQACTVIQWPHEKKVKFIDVIKVPNIGTEGMCDIVLERYKGYIYVINGDYSGQNVSSLFKEQVTNYSIIKKKLNLNSGQIKIEPNPSLTKNRTLVNKAFNEYPIEICPVKCKPLIYDCENVKLKADGTILKDDRDDPAQQADVLDTARYWFNKNMKFLVAT